MLSAGRVDESVIHSRVRRLLDRMDREGRLRTPTGGDLDLVMNQIFPSAGTLDVTFYERYIDPADRTMVYHSVRQTETAPRAAERADLEMAMREAAATAQAVSSDEAGLRAVFGPGWTAARNNYGLIHCRLMAVASNIASRVTTDYNLDAQETFLGGWADFGTQHMHLLSEIVADPLTAESKATIIHEGAHLAASSIDDHVYYGTAGFEAADLATKKNNAAHYEELPRRAWGSSSFPGLTFRPGRSSSGARLTMEERIRAAGVEYFRKAWDAASDFDTLLKLARWNQLNRLPPGAAVEARLLEVSPLMDLTLHEQAASPPRISRLDVTTSESITRWSSLTSHTLPSPTSPFSPSCRHWRRSTCVPHP